jgi:hypothetical protein
VAVLAVLAVPAGAATFQALSLGASLASSSAFCAGPPLTRRRCHGSQWEDEHFDFNFDVRKGKIFTEWFRGGRTNIAYNCLDRHVAEGRGDQTAILWEGNDPGIDRKMTYKEVLEDVCRLVRGEGSVPMAHSCKHQGYVFSYAVTEV